MSRKQHDLAPEFRALFEGMERAHGTYNNIDKTRGDGKRTGDPLTKREPVTDELWAAHLLGINGIGIIPIRDDNTCFFGAIDIDVYGTLDPCAVARQLLEWKLPLIPCRSKSGGLHVFLFADVAVPANLMQTRLRDIAARLGHGNSEIFPKQSQLSGDSRDLGSWINMPYFGGDQTNRYAINPHGDPYTMNDFLHKAKALRAHAPLRWFEGKESKKRTDEIQVLPDGPPCLQHLIQLGFPEGTRNQGLFALGVYMRKAHPNDWADRVDGANNQFFSEPLPVEEVRTVKQSLARGKEYHYPCSKHPLAPHCNAVQCRSRKFGVGGGGSALPVLGQLRKLLTVPPVWYLDVTNRDGDVLALEMSTDELQDPASFQKKCMDQLDIMPQMPSRIVWQQTINSLLEGVDRLDPPPEDASIEGMFWDLLEQFCTGRTQAQTIEEVLLGKPYTLEGRTYFRTADLLKFLGRVGFKDLKVQQIAKVLKMKRTKGNKAYVSHEGKRVGTRFVNLWSVPEFSPRVEAVPVPDAVDADKEGGLF